MEPDWVHGLRRHLGERCAGDSRIFNLHRHGDSVRITQLSGEEFAIIGRVECSSSCQDLKALLAIHLCAREADINLFRGSAKMKDNDIIGDLDGIAVQQRGVCMQKDFTDLFPFQRQAVQFALQRHGRVLLGHEMGLGKTAMALAIIANYRAEWPVLVIAPPILLHQWAQEIVKWLLDVSSDEVQLVLKPTMVRQKKTVLIEIKPTAKFILVSYGMLVGQTKKVAHGFGKEQTNGHLRVQSKGGPYKTIIVDEAHALKSIDSNRTKIILPMLHEATRVVLMTGTPMANSSAAEVLPLLKAVAGAQTPFPSFQQWCEHYCAENRPIWTGYREIPRWKGVNPQYQEDLHNLLRVVMVRKRTGDVLVELPSKRRAKVSLELTAAEMKSVSAQRMKIQDFEKRVTELVSDEDQKNPGSLVQDVMQVFKLLAEAKQGAVCEWLETTFFDGHEACGSKLIIFAHHRSVHEKLSSFLTAQLGCKGDKWIHITGETSAAERTRQLEHFKDEEHCHVALLALQACNAGLNLAVANVCVFAELCWSPSTLEQAEARVHRMGQQAKCVLIYYLVAGGSDSPDLIMFQALLKKADTVSRVVDGDSCTSLRSFVPVTPKRRQRAPKDDESTPVATPKRRQRVPKDDESTPVANPKRRKTLTNDKA